MHMHPAALHAKYIQLPYMHMHPPAFYVHVTSCPINKYKHARRAKKEFIILKSWEAEKLPTENKWDLYNSNLVKWHMYAKNQEVNYHVAVVLENKWSMNDWMIIQTDLLLWWLNNILESYW